jgi:hypothetical protein
MPTYHIPANRELMDAARTALQGRLASANSSAAPQAVPLDRIAQLRDLIGPAPGAFEKPAFGTPGYALGRALGWIGEEQAAIDLAAHEERRLRALQTCHRHRLYERPHYDPPRESGAYVPELAARLEDDRNLTDGARRCARKLAEETYRRNRAGRSLEVTVTYLSRALGKCRRTVQRYLRALEREGYIGVDVVRGARSRLCTGLIVHLLNPLFARHHAKRWPACAKPEPRFGEGEPRSAAIPGATQKSQNQSFRGFSTGSGARISRKTWALKCMDGVYRALMKTAPLLAGAS